MRYSCEDRYTVTFLSKCFPYIALRCFFNERKGKWPTEESAWFPCLLESPGFFCKISRPWKVLKKIKSWKFLGYDVGGRHNDADEKIS